MGKKIIVYLIVFAAVAGSLAVFLYWLRRIPPEILNTTPSGLVTGGVLQDAIPAINEPDYESIAVADTHLSDDGLGIAVSLEGYDLFYPYQILAWHEIINEDQVLITYCPLCKSAAVFDLTDPDFGTSGQLYNNNLVLYDRKTESLWSQLVAAAIDGSRAGERLKPYPFAEMTWLAFKNAYPNGLTLSRNTGADRDYTQDPYWDYYESGAILFALERVDTRLPLKTRVIGYADQTGSAKAWPVSALAQASVVNDTLTGQPLVLMHDPEYLTIRTFSRLVDNQELTFVWDGKQITDQQTGSVWDFSGTAQNGELAGTKLLPIATVPAYWFCWAAAHPATELLES